MDQDLSFESEAAASSSSAADSSSSGSESEEQEDAEIEEPIDEAFAIGYEAGSIASLIAVNQSYIDLIDRLLIKTQTLIHQNREQQAGFLLSKLVM